LKIPQDQYLDVRKGRQTKKKKEKKRKKNKKPV
jgi:hypothetical protein